MAFSPRWCRASKIQYYILARVERITRKERCVLEPHNVPRMGAALAYYALLSLMPMALVVISIAGLVFGTSTAELASCIRFRSLCCLRVSGSSSATFRKFLEGSEAINWRSPGGDPWFHAAKDLLQLRSRFDP
jgi:hypothetical protein